MFDGEMRAAYSRFLDGSAKEQQQRQQQQQQQAQTQAQECYAHQKASVKKQRGAFFSVVSLNPAVYGPVRGVRIHQSRITGRTASLRWVVDKIVMRPTAATSDAAAAAATEGRHGRNESQGGIARLWRVSPSNVRQFRVDLQANTHSAITNPASNAASSPASLFGCPPPPPLRPTRADLEGAGIVVGSTVFSFRQLQKVDASTERYLFFSLDDSDNSNGPGGTWHLSRSTSHSLVRPLSSLSRQPHTYGPARQVFARPFLIVAGTAGCGKGGEDGKDGKDGKDGATAAAEVALEVATLIANSHWFASRTRARIVTDDAPMGMSRGHNVVLVGGPGVNRWASSSSLPNKQSGGPPVTFDGTGFTVGACRCVDIETSCCTYTYGPAAD